MQALKGLVAAACLFVANSHSWVGCSDYRGDVSTYEDSKCFGYPRNFESARGASNLGDGYALGADTGYNYQQGNTCQFPLKTPYSSMYSTRCPMATYEVGSIYCAAWPTKNHVAASCTNQFIPDTTMIMFRSGVNPTTDPAQANMLPVTDYFGVHTNQQIDCLGYQRSPRFCDNTDKALATGCFQVDQNLTLGVYTFQWYWVFNQGSPPYVTCWEANVVAKGAGSGSGGLNGYSTVVDNLGGSSTSVCKDKWANVKAITPAGTGTPAPAPAPQPAPAPGPAAPQPAPAPPAATSGDKLYITKWPSQIPQSGAFNVEVQYSSTGDRALTVDIIANNTAATWYGKGVMMLGKGVSSTTVSVTVMQGSPALGGGYVLRAWMVDKALFDQWADPTTCNFGVVTSCTVKPWTMELDSNDQPVFVAASVGYDTCAVQPCATYATCANVATGGRTCSCNKGYQGDGVTSCAPSTTCPSSHTVLSSDTLLNLAKSNSITVDQLLTSNPSITTGIEAGDVLTIPCGAAATSCDPKKIYTAGDIAGTFFGTLLILLIIFFVVFWFLIKPKMQGSPAPVATKA